VPVDNRHGIGHTLATDLAADLADMGFADPEATARRVESWNSGTFRALRSEEAREAFDRVRPDVLRALAQAPDPVHALARWERLLAGLPSAINVFRLLEARPGLMDLVMRILAHAPTLAEALARRADLLDTLIDHSAFALPGSVDEIAASLARREVGDDYQRLLDAVRRKVGEWHFVLGVQLIEGTIPRWPWPPRSPAWPRRRSACWAARARPNLPASMAMCPARIRWCSGSGGWAGPRSPMHQTSTWCSCSAGRTMPMPANRMGRGLWAARSISTGWPSG
jgi:hypothetical protein